MDDLGKWVLGVLVTVLHGALWWIWKKQDTRLDSVEDKTHENEIHLMQFKIQAAENFSNKNETQATLLRLHGKIEELGDKVVTQFNDLRKDFREELKEAVKTMKGE